MRITERRRGLATSLPALFLLAAACHRPDPPPPSAPAESRPAPSTLPGSDRHAQEGFYRLRLGALHVTVVSDGTVVRDATELMTKLPKEDIRRMASESFREPRMQLSINAFLIERAGHLVLIDTGAGDLFKPEAGLLSQNLRAAGHDPARIEAVILSHIHADHSGGLMQGGAKVFPGATIHVPAADHDLFLNRSEEAKAPEEVRHIFRDAEACLGPYVRSGQVRRYEWSTEIVPGITGAPAPGHTPGHTYLTVESQGARLVILGDTIHVAEVQFTRPEAAATLDMDQDAAVAQRRRGLEAVAAAGSLVAFPHVSFPGLGHLRRQGSGFAWLPAPYELVSTP